MLPTYSFDKFVSASDEQHNVGAHLLFFLEPYKAIGGFLICERLLFGMLGDHIHYETRPMVMDDSRLFANRLEIYERFGIVHCVTLDRYLL